MMASEITKLVERSVGIGAEVGVRYTAIEGTPIYHEGTAIYRLTGTDYFAVATGNAAPQFVNAYYIARAWLTIEGEKL